MIVISSHCYTSTADIQTELQEDVSFAQPFILVCESSTGLEKAAAPSVTAIYRLVSRGALSKGCVQPIMRALKNVLHVGVDLQLRILQILPSLLTTYPQSTKGEALYECLRLCHALCLTKTGGISNTAIATFQQMVVSVYDRAAAGNGQGSDDEDALHLFIDLCVSTGGSGGRAETTNYLKLKSLSVPVGLEVIEAVLVNHSALFKTRKELSNGLRTSLLPLLLRLLSETNEFPIQVRTHRLFRLVLRDNWLLAQSECEVGLGFFAHTLEPDAAPTWKRVLAMELLRDTLVSPDRLLLMFRTYDETEGHKNIMSILTSTFKRLLNEKPELLGDAAASIALDKINERSTSEVKAIGTDSTSGVSGFLWSNEHMQPGLSKESSLARLPLIDMLDKSEPSSFPETYLYYLTFNTLTSITSSIASEYQKLSIEMASKDDRNIDLLARFIETQWPAVLATYSNLFDAALSSDLYRTLVITFENFIHTAGQLRQKIPQDAMLLALAKAAVPPSLMYSAANTTQSSQGAVPPSPDTKSRDRTLQRQSSSSFLHGSETKPPTFSSRNILPAKSLIRLGMSLSDVLDDSWIILLDAFQQIDFISHKTAQKAMTKRSFSNFTAQSTQPSSISSDGDDISESNVLTVEINFIFETTNKLSLNQLLQIVSALCSLSSNAAHLSLPSDASNHSQPSNLTRSPPYSRSSSRRSSFKAGGIWEITDVEYRTYSLNKLAYILELNHTRLIDRDESSIWNISLEHLGDLVRSKHIASPIRLRATDIITDICALVMTSSLDISDVQLRITIQGKSLEFLRSVVSSILSGKESSHSEVSTTRATDYEIYRKHLEIVKVILESTGHTLRGKVLWECLLALIGPAVEMTEFWTSSRRLDSITRVAFPCIQIICSEFLSNLEPAVLVRLIDIVTLFSNHASDTNTSLAASGILWNISDHLRSFIKHSDNLSPSEIPSNAFQVKLPLLLLDGEMDSKRAELLWIHLLFSLRDLSACDDLQVGTGSMKILLRIFDTYGSQLSSTIWHLLLWNILFPLIEAQKDDTSSIEGHDEKNESLIAIFNGFGELFSQFLGHILRISDFDEAWAQYLSYITTVCRFSSTDVALSGLQCFERTIEAASRLDENTLQETSKFWNMAWEVWLSLGPAHGENEVAYNQAALKVYVEVCRYFYRLLTRETSTSFLAPMLVNFEQAIVFTGSERQPVDKDILSPLQKTVFSIVEMITLENKDTFNGILNFLSKTACLACEHRKLVVMKQIKRDMKHPRYVALSQASIQKLDNLFSHRSDFYESESSVLTCLKQLLVPINMKYDCPQGKSSIEPLWKLATQCYLTILRCKPFVKDSQYQLLEQGVSVTLECLRSILLVRV